MKTYLLIAVMLLVSIVSLNALKLSEVQSTGLLVISQCNGSGYHTVTSDFGTETISCSDLIKLEGEFAAESGTDMKLDSATWIELSNGNMAYQVICVGSGKGCNSAKSQAFDETGNPIFNH